MKTTLLKLTTLCLGVISIASCKKDHLLDCFKSSGRDITIERPIAGFNSIETNNNVDLIFRQDTVYTIKITAGENLINGITTRVENNKLLIHNENKCNWVRDFKNKYTVEISAPDLTELFNNGSGNITFTDTLRTYSFQYDNSNASGQIYLLLNVDRIFVNIHTGTADVVAKGKAGMNQLFYNGYGKMDFSELQTGLTYINNSGSNDCYITVKDLLYVKLTSIGSIYYKGNPSDFETNITGTGQLIHE